MNRKKLKIGNLYIVKMKDERSVDLVRELNKTEIWVLNAKHYISSALKAVAVVASVLCPPLLLVTIPLMLRGQNEKNN